MAHLRNPCFGRATISSGGARYSPPPDGIATAQLPHLDLSEPWAARLRASFSGTYDRMSRHKGSQSGQAEDLERLVGHVVCGQAEFVVAGLDQAPAALKFNGQPGAESAYGWAWNTGYVCAVRVLRKRLLGPELPKDLQEHWEELQDGRSLADWEARGKERGELRPTMNPEELVTRFPSELAEMHLLDPSAVPLNVKAVREMLALVDEVVRDEPDPSARYALLVRRCLSKKKPWWLALHCGYAMSGDFAELLWVGVDILNGNVVMSSGPGQSSDDLPLAHWGAIESARSILAAVHNQFSSGAAVESGRAFDKHVEQFAQVSPYGLDEKGLPQPDTIRSWLAGHPAQEWAQQMAEAFEAALSSGRARFR